MWELYSSIIFYPSPSCLAFLSVAIKRRGPRAGVMIRWGGGGGNHSYVPFLSPNAATVPTNESSLNLENTADADK